MPSSFSDNFTINANTGELRNVGELDREAMDPKLEGKIDLRISATDRGTPPLSSFVTVIINVEVSFQVCAADLLMHPLWASMITVFF